MWSSFSGWFDVGTLYADGDNLVTTQRPQGTAGQSIWGSFHIAYRRIAAGFGYRRHAAGLRTIDQRDCTFGFRLYPGRSEWTCITNLSRFVSSLCRLWRLAQSSYG